MIPHKEYLQLKEFAEKNGLPSDKETLRVYVKMIEKYNEDLTKENWKLKLKNLEGRLQYGEMSIKRKEFEGHISVCREVVKRVDVAMKLEFSLERGKMIAAALNMLSMSVESIIMFVLSKPATTEDTADYEGGLLKSFYDKQDELILRAAMDDTKRHNLQYSLEGLSGNGGIANYNKKEGRFTFIQYTLKGYAKQIQL